MKYYIKHYFDMKKTAFYLLALLPMLSFGQATGLNPQSGQSAGGNIPKIIPAAPSVAALMKLEEIPVDNYTGTPGIAIPLHSFALDGGLSLDLGINYSSTGVRPDDIPSWVGAGWSLSCGGSISRTMLDRPDDKYLGILVNDFEKLPQLDKWHSEEWLWKANRFAWDTEPDLFQFNFMGKTGRFILRKDATTGAISVVDLTGEGVRKISVSISDGSGTPIHDRPILGFEIVDDMGYIYSFGVADYTSASSQDNSSSDFYDSAWHLTKIETPDHRLLCSFGYQTTTETYITPKSVTNYDAQLPPFVLPTGQSPIIMLPPMVTSFSNMLVSSKVLSTVTVPGKGSISFTISPRTQAFEQPTEQYSGYKLNSIDIKNADALTIKNFVFNTESTVLHGFKMYLNSIDEIYTQTPTKKYAYKMAYKSGNMPKWGTLSKDYWGYFNGAANETLAPMKGANREVNAATMLYGVLESISYTNGGTKQYTFEPNEFSYIGKRKLDPLNANEFPENRVLVPNTINYTTSAGVTSTTIHILDDQFVNFNLKATAYSTSFPYLKNDVAGTDLRVVPFTPPSQTASGPVTTLNISQCSAYGTNLSQQNIIEVTECSKNVRLIPGWYRIELTNSSGYVSSMPVTYKLTFSYFTMSPLYKSTKGGGLRIKKTELKDGTAIKSTNLYNYSDLSDPTYSSGSQALVAKKLPYYLSKSSYAAPSGGFTIGSFYWDTRMPYRVFDDQSGLDIPLSKGNFVTYKNVTVKKAEPSPNPLVIPVTLNGRTEYTYTAMQDFDDNGDSENFMVEYPYIKVPSYDYKRGLLKKKEIFGNDGRILTRELTDYQYIDQLKEFGFTMKQKWDCDCPISADMTHYDDVKNFLLDFYQHQTGIGEPLLTIEQATELYNNAWAASEFSLGSQFVTDCIFTRRYQWLFPNKYVVGWASPITKTTETHLYDTAGVEKVITENERYTYNSENQQLASVTTTLSPTENTTTYYKYVSDVLAANSLPGGNLASLDFNAIVKMQSQNRVSVPVQTQTVRNSTSVLQTQRTTFQIIGSNGFVAPRTIQVSKGTGALEDKFTYTEVNSTTGNVTSTLKDGLKTYYVWGYKEKLPIAQIEYTDNQVLPQSLFTAATNASDAVGQSGLAEALKAIRTAMPTAMVTTYTYTPWIGMASVTDPKGYTLYYDYDEFFRLKAVKDKDTAENFTILSTNEYNYKAVTP